MSSIQIDQSCFQGIRVKIDGLQSALLVVLNCVNNPQTKLIKTQRTIF